MKLPPIEQLPIDGYPESFKPVNIPDTRAVSMGATALDGRVY